MRLLQLVVGLWLYLLFFFFVLCGRLGSCLRVGSARGSLHLHFQLGLPVYPIYDDIVVLQVALNHLYLGVWLVELLVVAISIENNDLKMFREVAKAINGADSNPHVVGHLLILIAVIVVVARHRVGLLLKVLLRHDVILLARDAAILEEVAQDALKVYHDYWVVEFVSTPSKIVPVGPLKVLISLWVQLHFDVLLLNLRRLRDHRLLCLRLAELLLLLQLCLALLAEVGHAVLVRVAGGILDAHFRSLTVLRHGLRVFVALVAQLENACLLGHVEARRVGAGDRAARHKLIALAPHLLVGHVFFVAEVLGLSHLPVGHQRRPLVEALHGHYLGVSCDHFDAGPLLHLRIIKLSRYDLRKHCRIGGTAAVNRPLARERQVRAVHGQVYLELLRGRCLLLQHRLLELLLPDDVLWIEFLDHLPVIIIVLIRLKRLHIGRKFRSLLHQICRCCVLLRRGRVRHDRGAVEGVARLQTHLLSNHHAGDHGLIGTRELLARAADHCAVRCRNRGADRGLIRGQLLLWHASASIPFLEEGRLRLVRQLLSVSSDRVAVLVDHLHLRVRLPHHVLLVNNHLWSLRSDHGEVVRVAVWPTSTAVHMMLQWLGVHQ